jgi:hypothetical protein
MLISFLHPTEPFREHHHGAGGLAAMQAFRACFEVRRPSTSQTQTSLSGFRSLAPHTAGFVQASPPRRMNPGSCNKPDFTASEKSQQVFVTATGPATSMRKAQIGSWIDQKSNRTRCRVRARYCELRQPDHRGACARKPSNVSGDGSIASHRGRIAKTTGDGCCWSS